MNDVLFVWLYPPGQFAPVPCGRLTLLQGRYCMFEYDERFLARPEALPLSPDLPLRSGAFEPLMGQPLPPVFEDAGPDRWGRQVIDKVFQPARRSPLDYLALAGEDRIGALGFSTSSYDYQMPQEEAFNRSDLADLSAAAKALECRMPIDERLRRLLRPGSSAGGARPKAIIDDEGRKWIAKFSSASDEADFCAIEHASLRLAEACSIEVPVSRLVSVGGRSILLVERFDREPDGSRVHVVSARTLLMSQGIEEQHAAYADIADIVRRDSNHPRRDCLQLFRRMAFNVLIENTDDHGKNHAFRHQKGRWDLAPAYDLQPQLQGVPYQQLIVGKDGYEPTIANVLSLSGRFLLSEDQAQSEIEQILDVLRTWRDRFAQEGVSKPDLDLCERFVLAERMFAGWPKEASRPKPGSLSRPRGGR